MFKTTSARTIRQTIAASVVTDTGCVRSSNEDRGRHLIPNDTETQTARGTLTIVADGMGGHASGEVASQMAVDLISEFYYADRVSDTRTALRQAVEFANLVIFETSVSDEEFYGMGTTVIALVILDGVGYSAHVGDSRLYRLRGEELEQITMDHSQVMEMYKQGIISWEESKTHEDKNIILRAVGTQAEVEVEVSDPFAIDGGDEFMLCSDGLSDMVDDDEIRLIWIASKNVHDAGEQLVSRAKQKGGHDNVTVAMLRIPPAAELPIVRTAPITRETGVLPS